MKALRILSWLCLYKLHRLLQSCNIFLFQLKFYILAFGNFVLFLLLTAKRLNMWIWLSCLHIWQLMILRCTDDLLIILLDLTLEASSSACVDLKCSNYKYPKWYLWLVLFLSNIKSIWNHYGIFKQNLIFVTLSLSLSP